MIEYAAFPLGFIAYCLSGFLLSAHNRLKREVQDLKAKIDQMEAAASGSSTG
jgi:hypothetical protein